MDLLLNFNENVLDFDSSIVSQAAKTKVKMVKAYNGGFSSGHWQVESFFYDLSNTIDDFAVPR